MGCLERWTWQLDEEREGDSITRSTIVQFTKTGLLNDDYMYIYVFWSLCIRVHTIACARDYACMYIHIYIYIYI